jgi:hypothetical protein
MHASIHRSSVVRERRRHGSSMCCTGVGSNVCGHNGNKWEGSDVVRVICAVYANRNCDLGVS